MAVNINDRRRVSILIEQEFRARRAALNSEPSEDEIATEMESILVKAKIKDRVAKLKSARAAVAELESSLSTTLVAMRKKKKIVKSRYRENCECHENYAEVLEEIAKANLIAASNAKALSDKLHADERKLLAKIEIAQSVDDLTKVVRACGLVN